VRRALGQHWPEYLMEASGLGLFVLAACGFASLLEHPESPLRQAVADPDLRRTLFGLAAGVVTAGFVYSPWGQQSGAHLNPAVTLTFFRLGKIDPWDQCFYVLAQFAGAHGGIVVGVATFGRALEHPAVNFGAAVPGMAGAGAAFIAEGSISYGFMLAALVCTNSRALARYTGAVCGALVALFVVLEGPLSGTSMNPAEALASAVPAHVWMDLWVYFTAPPLGMLLAAESYVRLRGARGVVCAKLNHQNDKRCIFRCGYAQRTTAAG
jgi:aquaporin Z